jgi:hypothetical protein
MSTWLALHTQPEMTPMPLQDDPECGFSSCPSAHRGAGAARPTVKAVVTMTARAKITKRVFHIIFALLSWLGCNRKVAFVFCKTSVITFALLSWLGGNRTGATAVPVVRERSPPRTMCKSLLHDQSLGVFLSGEQWRSEDRILPPVVHAVGNRKQDRGLTSERKEHFAAL